jgi:hypothetical protein
METSGEGMRQSRRKAEGTGGTLEGKNNIVKKSKREN